MVNMLAHRCLRFGLMGAFLLPGLAQTAMPQPLSADDVSWLFPPPKQAADLQKLISLADLASANPTDPTKRDAIWSDTAFQQFLGIASSTASQVDGTQTRIGLPAGAQSKANWFIAGVRIDPGAPGLSDDIRAQFGQSPEIRLIVQLVTPGANGAIQVNDLAGHLIFDFRSGQDNPAQANCLPRPKPDMVAFKGIVEDLAAIRTKLSSGQLGANKVLTAGHVLSVHPGLADATTASGLRQEMKAFLERHISAQLLDAMAVAGVPAGARAPWIFLSMLDPSSVVPTLPKGNFEPVHGPTLDGQQFAQMLAPGGTSPRVVPMPATNNGNAITCRNAAVSVDSLPSTARSGSSTSELFASPSPSADQTKTILDLIADPNRSHFFNTDCVSCHTETRRDMELLQVNSIAGIDSAALPPGPWTVRNFGWSPPSDGVQASVTRRTATETAAVVAFINSQILNK